MFTSKFGQLGEEIARNLLIKKGYKILQKNFRSKFGEIDIIAEDGDTIVFVEVKTRWSEKFGSPEEAVTPGKLKKIIRTIDYFYLLNPELTKKQRVEVAAIEMWEGQIKSYKIIKVD